ncbi:calcineurin-like phosphoesterase C-terminal domain-containing protein [Methylobacterium frigidaeris]|uniref:3',5'-cyclic adenosine monophosphate phosphodiesterase CpdA n=1 Tax=Methylobacterium frigidaeris TaxID=2038277 RepID=A0AA37HAG2_9HYPH|nr:calcineurin-like phosphoesterase family protein [Methylobacterium frigidaeris]PIK68969.1 Cna protein B-type domain containing protein [Methylobacterium frigidaeris]GJD62249.1 3',5'-cyclic adenosine monophosphate phosphodiesterase CpdA [Methylobacterium frigidaeris]
MTDHRTLTRRTTLTGATALALAPLAARAQGAPAGGQGTGHVTGIVYEDTGGKGRRGPDDPGLRDVLVSNGREVVRTDRDGRYTLPVGDEAVIFVIKPTGFALPLGSDGLPRFSYLHQPAGTPPDLALRYPGIAPTGPLPPSVDFGLVRSPESGDFDVVLFTDPQPESHAELTFVRDTAIARVLGAKAASGKVAFGMTTGDVLFDDLSLYPRQNRLIAQLGVPWFHLGGNHDLNFEAPDARYSRETFKRTFGAPYYALEHGGVLFVMLDNVNYLGPHTATAGRGGRYEGRIGERQLAFVENLLTRSPTDRLVVVAMHIPLASDLGPDEPGISTVDRAQLLRLLAGRPSVSVAGHTHTTEHHYLGPDGRPGFQQGATGGDAHHHHVLTAVSGSWWSGPPDRRGIATADSRDGTPHGYHVLSITGGRHYTTRYVPASDDAGRQMRIVLESQFHGDDLARLPDTRLYELLGATIPAESAGATNVVVNLFDGGPRSRVSFRIGDGPLVPMTRTRRPDPFVAALYARNGATRKSWVKAEPCSHLWVARLPRDLQAGTHRLIVEATDEYGRPHRDALVLEILDGASRAG